MVKENLLVADLGIIDLKRKVRIKASLRDENGNEISPNQIGADIINLIDDKFLSDPTGSIPSKILPLIGQISGFAVPQLSASAEGASIILASEDIRHTTIFLMLLSFLLLEVMRKRKLTIHTSEEKLSDFEINEAIRQDREGAVKIFAGIMGLDMNTLVKKLKDRSISVDQIPPGLRRLFGNGGNDDNKGGLN